MLVALAKNKTAQLVFSNTFFQLFGKVISMSITMFTTVLIARNYGVDGYGYFSLMQTIPALFFIIVDFGFNAVVMKHLTESADKAKMYFFNVLAIRVIFSVILMVLTASIIYFFFPYPSDLKFGIYLSLFLILSHALYTTGNLIFQFKLKYDYSVIGYIAGSILILFLSLWLIHKDASIVWVNFTYVIGGFFTFFVSIRYLKRLGVIFSKPFEIDFALWKPLFIASLPLGLTFLFSQVNFRADTIMLSKMKLPEDFGFTNVQTVAIYGLAYKVFEVCLVIPTFFMNAAYPIYVKKLGVSARAFKDVFLKTLGVLFLVGGLLSVIGYIFAPFMVSVIGGEQFSDSVVSLRVLFGGIAVFFATAPVSYFILTLGKQLYLPIAYALGGTFNVVANLWIIPRFSYIGSSYLTWMSELVILLLLCLFAVRAWRLYNTSNVQQSG